ncbi:ferric reductase-like transmembrane domain-containing protein [Grimontia sp. AD028]|uniref:ferredoxin reductase family protein n=1 Tax=Grimontia sp. AD028 TaxID=1581149 RepID=UPI0009E44460|nr:ferric reductase-like transmembrane domain-containing protein [Grimontia sp. AD028]
MKLKFALDNRKNILVAGAVLLSFIGIGSLLPEELTLQRWIAAFFAANALVGMALAFLLSTRIEILESIFGGLDRVYKAHRWAGIWSVFSIFMHWWLVPQSEVAREETSLIEIGSDTGEWATWLLLVLVVISFMRMLPYHLWKWSHRLMGLVFFISVFHYLFAVRPFQLFSPAGIAMNLTAVIGVWAWYYYAFGKDTSKHYIAKVENVKKQNGIVSFDTKPLQGKPKWEAGQFAFVSVLHNDNIKSEPHPYTIASSDHGGKPSFSIAPLGDYTKTLYEHLENGQMIRLDMPYGRFRLDMKAKEQIWIGSGIGITPFIAWLQSLNSQSKQHPSVTLYYLVKNEEAAIFAKELGELVEGLPTVNLNIVYSEQGRLTPEKIAEDINGDIGDVSLYFCGNPEVRKTMQEGLEQLGMPKNNTHYELFDFRGAL